MLAEGANALQGNYGQWVLILIKELIPIRWCGSANALQTAPNGVLTETFDVKYAMDNLVSAGVGE